MGGKAGGKASVDAAAAAAERGKRSGTAAEIASGERVGVLLGQRGLEEAEAGAGGSGEKEGGGGGGEGKAREVSERCALEESRKTKNRIKKGM